MELPEFPIFAGTMAEHPREKKRLGEKLRNKYRLVILNDDTFEEKLSLKLSRLNVFLISGFSALLLIVITILLIAFTPLREYIPGYSSTALKRKAFELDVLSDSLERRMTYQKRYLLNLQHLIEGQDPLTFSDTTVSDSVIQVELQESLSKPESLLQAYVREEERFSVSPADDEGLTSKTINFFPPIKGIITDSFSLQQDHLGTDIVAQENSVIKSAQEGVVILAEWTAKTGQVLIIQHPEEYISVYKHNSSLLKKQGEAVSTGEPIAIIGNTGVYSSGPHLHFELWYQGYPVDPQQYMEL